ncbi:hypothetical protein RDI58_023593 [Solanum bulbocastanum]|uniref:Uncharacterized protein n=1 Tax=Solanum bulbocastanum TaxID=147425 RepID=A0AAN8T4U8_SOLBU
MAESRSGGYVCSGSFMSNKLQTKGDSGIRVERTGDGRMGGRVKTRRKQEFRHLTLLVSFPYDSHPFLTAPFLGKAE